MTDASALLKRYASERDEEAFGEVVSRYYRFVYGVASRRLDGDATSAMDVAQLVFTDLARKAGGLRDDSQLGGWLHSHTCFTASKWVRSEIRRNVREQRAAQLNSENPDELWSSISPMIDEALQALSEADRSAILLRYFEGRDLRTVGRALNVTEDTAQKRVQRALDKLKALLVARGVAVSSVTLGALLLVNASPAVGAPIQAVAAKAMVNRARARVFVDSLSVRAAAVLALMLVLGGLVVSRNFFGKNSTTSTLTAPTVQSMATGVADEAVNADSSNGAGQAIAVGASIENSASVSVRPPGRFLKVIVLSRTDRMPIVSATIRFTTNSMANPYQAAVTDPTLLTDAKGIAFVPLPPPDSRWLQLYISADGHADWLSIWDKNADEIIPAEHTVMLEAGVAIGGVAVDVENRPVAGAEVTLSRFWSGNERSDRGHQRTEISFVKRETDATGAWSVNRIPAALLDVFGIHIIHPQFARADKTIDESILAELRALKWRAVLTNGFRITGRVTATNGTAIVGAQVGFGGLYYTKHRNTKTGADGRYELNNVVPNNSREVVGVTAEGFAPDRKTIGTTQGGEIDFVLQAGGVFRGRVVDGFGKPIPGVNISREMEEPAADQTFEWSGKTDWEGKFVWTSGPQERQLFSFRHPGFLENVIRLSPGESEQVIAMSNRKTVKGTVVDADTLRPIEAFSVALGSGRAADVWASSLDSDRPFKNGSFELSQDSTKYDFVRIRAAGYLTTNVPLQEGAVVAMLQPSKLLEGWLVDRQGAPVVGAEVVAIGDHRTLYAGLGKGKFVRGQVVADYVVSRDDGRFSLPLSYPAKTLMAIHFEDGVAEVAVTNFRPNQELVMQPWGRIEGTVLLENRPKEKVSITLDNVVDGLRMDYRCFGAVTDQNGRFAFDKVPPRLMGVWLPNFRNAGTNVVVGPGVVTYLEIQLPGATP